MTPIFRGLSPSHNAYENALQGIASPGDVDGHANVIAHNAGTTSAGKSGVILQTTIEEMRARGVNILESPDFFDESEILLERLIAGGKPARRRLAVLEQSLRKGLA